MSTVVILKREVTTHYPGPGGPVEVVQVAFVSDLYGPRSVILPQASYRPATGQELAVNARYQVMPVDKKAEDAERAAIAEALKPEATGTPDSFDLP
jgi:hypothetical protein